ncbi:transglutaminase-like putative cysteine protease [Microbacterium marinum]|uniref:Transglutaminase-like putative cysteine protease n=1 Tax=Microbacterium marinum TaxID=421115 RepID=A0A7W7BMG7_9MICO|nr:transglutaminaseTgpA domain-containing protein [Microbacterium marinum]MBB4665357.1 transglutaminase-like putative cysteine protease [Microbacterium marinum]
MSGFSWRTPAVDLRRLITDVAAVVLLIAVAVIGFAATFEGPQYLVAAIGALVIGLALAWVGLRWRWGVLSLSGATIGAYFLFGGALALPHTALLGVIPTIETWRQLAIGVVTSWKDLLTTVPPVAPSDGHLIVPFLMTLAASVLGGSLALRAKHAAWALLPLALYLGLAILMGTAQPTAPLLQGVIFAIVAVLWLALRALWSPDRAAVVAEAPGAGASRAARLRRLVSGGVVLALAAGVGVAAAASANPPVQRYILRDFVIPPFDIHDYPSPLQSWRKFVRDYETETLFQVSGLPDDGRVRLATMDAYDGIVFNVADDGAGSSSAFTSVRSNMSPGAEGDPTTVRVEVDQLDGVWLPTVGAAKEFLFDGDRASDLRRGAHFNDATGTAVSTAALQAGDAYTIDTVIPVVPKDEVLADVPFAPLKMPKQEGIPQSLSELASNATEDAESPIERARALESYLQSDGYFSHGLADDVYSPSGHGAARISQLVGGEQMIGDDEQYAVAMALMATQLGMPARVVMGWYPDEEERSADGTFSATGDNLHAWVEIAFTGHGWIPFDPTPDEDNEPSEQNTKPRANPKPQVLQPPPPAQEPAELPPALAEDRGQDDEDEAGFDWLGPILLYSGISLGVIALLLSPFLVIGAIKAARRTKRFTAPRAADRISGGWDELVDRAADYRVAVPAGATRAESAEVVGAAFAGERVTTLARRADADVYGPGEPTPEDVDAFWREVDDIVGGIAGGTTFWKRLRARLSLRSLRRRAPKAGSSR